MTSREPFDALGLDSDDLEAWNDTGLPDSALDDWLVDRAARRPAGRRAREVYGAPGVHEFARRALLDAVALEPGERLLDVGCGGGLLLRDALASGADISGIDHSEEMTALARLRAPGSRVVLGDAEHLPFPDVSFSAVTLALVFFFFAEPVRVLLQCERVLEPEGRLAIYTSGPELRGTPAAPEPIASRGRFYEDDALGDLARQAGFHEVAVANDSGGQLLTAHKASGDGGA